MQHHSQTEPLPEFERIDVLRTEYLRELSGLAKVFITIATATLALTLAPLAPNLVAKTGIKWLVATWIALATTAVLGLVQIFFFSSSFDLRGDYLFSSLVVDTAARHGVPDEKLENLMQRADRPRVKYEKRRRWCLKFIVLQFLALLLAYGCLAVFMWDNLRVRVP
jgi:hypothetical protein